MGGVCHSEALALSALGIGSASAPRVQVARVARNDNTVGFVGYPLNPHKYRLGLQPNTPDFLDPLLNLIFQSEDFGGSGIAMVDDGEGVLAGDADVAKAESTGESGMLDEPGG